jgi:hypothetical protein
MDASWVVWDEVVSAERSGALEIGRGIRG